MHTVLDLDLDFFVWPPAYWPQWTGRMPLAAVERLATETEVQAFLEQSCGLSRTRPVIGKAITRHDEAFAVWRCWLSDGTVRAPFKVVHIDAHADLGLGDGGWKYLMTELLALPVGERDKPRTGPQAMNEGNYLAFALANRWIEELVYVFPVEPPELVTKREEMLRPWEREFVALQKEVGCKEEEPIAPDLMPYHFHKMDARTRRIELKYYDAIDDWKFGAIIPSVRWPEAVRYEPQVPFEAVPADQFRYAGFTHLIVASSPAFTPHVADALLPVVLQYSRC